MYYINALFPLNQRRLEVWLDHVVALRAPRVLECQLFRRDTCDRHGSGCSRS